MDRNGRMFVEHVFRWCFHLKCGFQMIYKMIQCPKCMIISMKYMSSNLVFGFCLCDAFRFPCAFLINSRWPGVLDVLNINLPQSTHCFGVTDVDSHPGPLTSLFQGISGHENMKTPGAEDKGTGKSVAGPETCMVDVLGCLGKHVFHWAVMSMGDLQDPKLEVL